MISVSLLLFLYLSMQPVSLVCVCCFNLARVYAIFFHLAITYNILFQLQVLK